MTRYIAILLFSFLISCSNYGQLTYITKLPKKLKENSGMAIGKDSTVWFVNDGGNEDKIYQINNKGKILKELEVKGIIKKNVVAGTPVKISYELTRKGIDLSSVFKSIGEWAEKWN